MQKLLNQRRTIYWLATFCCVIFGFIAIIFDRVGKFREVARKE